ncbi:hypothetical protein PGT21_006037 [Puccinia graminis f. sp. tritici]|uniref:Uncharacterized protein n=1 Tax=Puccinia graminis f. sp. tritici TaxID=56615 RepID=A0A5B0P8N4_PUCGR|nr:hypothetical protein PGT21_006037 [Puccinia graminis f. sp. tritici]KAA1134224.1 hypothetical protein PGTUg99_033153 [Puccinia graminis f. sp. tritici]
MDSDSDIEIVPSKAPASQGMTQTKQTQPKPKPAVVRDRSPSLSPLPLPKVLKRPAEKSIDVSPHADPEKDCERINKRSYQSSSASIAHRPSSPELPEPSRHSLSSELPAPLQLSPINSPQAQENRQDHRRTSDPASPPNSRKSQSQGVIELGSSPLVDIPSSFTKARMPISNNLSRQPSSSSSSGPSLKSLAKEQTCRANSNPKNPHQSGSARQQSKELSGSPIPFRNSHKSVPARQEAKELSASPIPVRKKSQNITPPVDPDSSGELSDLDSILARHNPSLHAPNRKRNDSTADKHQNLNDDLGVSTRNQSPALTGPLHRNHTSSAVLQSAAQRNKGLPRSHSAPQKSDKPQNAVDKGKGKAAQTSVRPLSLIDPGDENLLSDLDEFNFNYNRNPSPPPHLPSRPSSTHPSPPPNSAPVSKAAASRIEKQAQAAQARLLREAKKAAKEKEKQDNRLQREANKLTLNRKETVAEVRMWVPKSLKKSKLHPFAKACEVLEERISSTEGCMMRPPGEIDDEDSEPKGVVRWVRTATKEWDEERGIFVPFGLGKTVETSEPTVLVVWTGKDVDEVIASGSDQLMKKAQAIKAHYPQDQLFIVISGLETILKAERRNEDSRIMNEARVRLAAQRNEPPPCPSKSKSSGSTMPRNSRDKILKELEVMKIVTKAFVIRVEEKNEFANWLWEMTMEIGVRPYKSRKQELKSALRLEVSGTKGTNYEDTYIKMLSSLTRVTENEAKGIVARFPTLKSLYQSWERGIEKNGLVWAEDMLVGCSKSNSITNVNSNRKIGKVTSKRIFEIMYKAKNGDACL